MCALSGAWAPEGGLLLTQPQLPGHMLILQSASSFPHTILSVTDWQAQVLSGPRAPTHFQSSLAQAPAALGCSLFNGATPVWEQPGALDTERHLSGLANFF